MLAATIIVTGRVQGVGFRWWAQSTARRLGVTGSATNLPDGRVELRLQGSSSAVQEMITAAITQPPTGERPGRVDDFELHWRDPVTGEIGFRCS